MREEASALQHLQWEAEPLASQLEPEDFQDPQCRQIFSSMVFKDGTLDTGATEDNLPSSNLKGYRWLVFVSKAQYTGAPHQILHRLRVLRARKEAKEFESTADAPKIAQEFLDKSADISRMLKTRGETKEDLARKIKNGVPKTKTGFACFDDLCLGGIENGGTLVVAAMPGVGKSALAVNIAKNLVEDGKSVCFLSLEMSSEAIAMRLMQSFWGEKESKVREHAEEMIDMNGSFHPLMPSNDIDKLLGEATNYLESDIFIIDYFDLITTNKAENQSSRLESISRKIKDFAFRNKKPVVILSQLNKDLEKSSSNREPVLSDLHGTSALAKDAHIISFLWDKNTKGSDSRAADQLQDRKDDEQDLRWIIKKNRNGKLGMVYMDFEPETMTFSESKDTTLRV